jgi:hypothetical protein
MRALATAASIAAEVVNVVKAPDGKVPAMLLSTAKKNLSFKLDRFSAPTVALAVRTLSPAAGCVTVLVTGTKDVG